jgi:predicted small secreted protein
MKAKQTVFAGIAVLLTAAMFTLAGCDNTTGGVINPIKIVTPVAYPPGRELVTGTTREITLSTSTSGATIYYTTNGSIPTTGSAVYSDSSKPVITGPTTLKAIAVKAGMIGSDMLTSVYTFGSPNLIGTLAELNAISNNAANLNKNYKLTANIAGVTTPIGLVSGGGFIPFTGDFDGNGKTITLNITGGLPVSAGVFPGTYTGLFAVAGDRVHNLTVAGTVGVSGNVVFAGGVAGAALPTASFSEVTSSVAVTATGIFMVSAGGVAGVSQGEISDVTGSGNVSATGTGSVFAGGVAGISQGEISGASGSGNVTGIGSGDVYAGGIMGDAGGRVINVYTTGSVSATTSGTSSAYAGGIAGSAGVMLSYAYATGAITATGTGTGTTQDTIGAGGIAGSASSAVVKYTVALNSNVSASGNNYNRCSYRIASSRYGRLNTDGAANYGSEDLDPTVSGTGGSDHYGHEGDDQEDGTDVAVTGGPLPSVYTEPSQSWWNSTGFSGADTNVWEWGTEGLPVLK